MSGATDAVDERACSLCCDDIPCSRDVLQDLRSAHVISAFVSYRHRATHRNVGIDRQLSCRVLHPPGKCTWWLRSSRTTSVPRSPSVVRTLSRACRRRPFLSTRLPLVRRVAHHCRPVREDHFSTWASEHWFRGRQHDRRLAVFVEDDVAGPELAHNLQPYGVGTSVSSATPSLRVGLRDRRAASPARASSRARTHPGAG